jgi:hypothetical protein
MEKATFADRLLEAADLLLKHGKRSTAFRRRAVSTAYYAVFHSIDKLCADYVSRSASRQSEEYRRAYRALEHGQLKNAFKQPPLKDHITLGKICAAVLRLQEERNDADYLPPVAGVFTYDKAAELVEIARDTVGEIEKLKPGNEACRTLAISLLFKERKS